MIDPAKRRAYVAEWYRANRERLAPIRAAYRAAHTADKAKAAKALRDRDPETARAKQKAYDKKRAAQRAAYQVRNKAHITAYHAAYQAKHRVRKAAYRAVYWESHKEERAAYLKKWHAAHPGMMSVYSRNRRAREIGAEGSFTDAEWVARLEEYRGLCAYCGTAQATDVEHVIPLSRGGSNYISNIVPACKSCNRKKHTKTADEFLGRVAS